LVNFGHAWPERGVFPQPLAESAHRLATAFICHSRRCPLLEDNLLDERGGGRQKYATVFPDLATVPDREAGSWPQFVEASTVPFALISTRFVRRWN
jgi:hypothetical protein